MARRFPEALLGKLPEPARRPVAMLAVGLALMTPGGLLLDGDERARRTVEGDTLTAAVDRAKASEGPIAAAWEARAESRRLRHAAAGFARHYEIPLDLATRIYQAAEEAGVEPRVAFGLVRTESAFDRRAVSYAGAVGYTQLLPSTARWMAPGTTRGKLFETDTNLKIGFKYLRYLLDKYEGDERLALTAYNRGPGTVDRVLRRGRNPENGYADKVLSPKKGRRI